MLESKCQRERLPLHQIGLQSVQGEMTLSRLQGNRRFGWYDNSRGRGRGFSPAVNEEGAACLHASRHRSAAAEKAVVYVTVILNRKRDGHSVRDLPRGRTSPDNSLCRCW